MVANRYLAHIWLGCDLFVLQLHQNQLNKWQSRFLSGLVRSDPWYKTIAGQAWEREVTDEINWLVWLWLEMPDNLLIRPKSALRSYLYRTFHRLFHPTCPFSPSPLSLATTHSASRVPHPVRLMKMVSISTIVPETWVECVRISSQLMGGIYYREFAKSSMFPIDYFDIINT